VSSARAVSVRATHLARLAVAALAAFGIVAACTDLSGLAGSADVATPEGGASDGAVEAAEPPDAGTADTAPDDAAVRDDASQPVDASGCSSCDCDTDTFSSGDAGCAPPDAAGTDCDDLDPLVHPGQGYVASTWTSPHQPVGDWDCNGLTVKQLPHNVTCPPTTANCAATEGFKGDPACGASAPYVTCQIQLLSCVVKTTVMRDQGCK
jgi:hypothetical protein